MQLRLCKSLAVGIVAFGAAATAAPPSTQPAEITNLIRQLGDDSYAARQAALRRLREIGKPAIPGLQQAIKNDDLEISLRADELVKELLRPPIPMDVPQPPVPGNGGIYPFRYREEEHNGVRIVDASENGRSIHIERYPTGVIMTITGQIAGQPATRTYRFRELADLRQANPEAYMLYLAYIHNDNKLGNGVQAQVQVQVQGGFVQIVRPPMGGMLPVPLPPIIVQAPVEHDELDTLEQKLLEQMRQQHIPPPQQDKVTGLLRDLRLARPNMIDPAHIEQEMRLYNDRSDELRKELAELKLPDPGNALPPESRSRLGISANEDPRDGIIVSHVLPNSRGDKLGLQEGDILQSVNGHPIGTTQELRRLVSDTPKGLVVEGMRAGKPFKLEEK
jgi:hypothetical protein